MYPDMNIKTFIAVFAICFTIVTLLCWSSDRVELWIDKRKENRCKRPISKKSTKTAAMTRYANELENRLETLEKEKQQLQEDIIIQKETVNRYKEQIDTDAYWFAKWSGCNNDVLSNIKPERNFKWTADTIALKTPQNRKDEQDG